MNKIKEVFLYVAISRDNVMPWKHLRIIGPTMGIPGDTLIPLTKGQERIALMFSLL